MDKLLITPQDVINNTLNDKNFDPALIKEQYIDRAQREYIKPLLGEDLYEDIKDNPTTTTNEALIDKLFPAITLFSLYEALPFVWGRIAAQGIMINTPDFSRPLGRSEMGYFRDNIFAQAEFEREEANKFLKDNKSDYPLWDKGDDINKHKNKLILY